MPEEINWNNREEILIKITRNCLKIDKLDYFKTMSKEESFLVYDMIEEGLINYNLVMQKGPRILKEIYGMRNRGLGDYLETKLFEVATLSVKKDSSKKLLKYFLDSFWADKLKDYNHCRKISSLAGVPKDRQNFLYKHIISKTL